MAGLLETMLKEKAETLGPRGGGCCRGPAHRASARKCLEAPQTCSGGGPSPLVGSEFGHTGHKGCFCQGSAFNVSSDINENKSLVP